MCGRRRGATHSPTKLQTPKSPSQLSHPASGNQTPASGHPSQNSKFSSSTTTGRTSSSTSTSAIRSVLPQKPILFPLSELSRATQNFSLTNRISGSTATWSCVIRDSPVVITRRPLSQPISPAEFANCLADLCSIHHTGVATLIGACADGSNVYLAHEFVSGCSLAEVLRPNRSGPTVLSNWIARARVALDVAKALEYVHHDIPIHYVHKHLKSSSVIVTDPDLRARITQFGTSVLSGEVSLRVDNRNSSSSDYDDELERLPITGNLRTAGSKKITGEQGYMAPEYLSGVMLTQKSDLFSFGVLLLEILTGREPVSFVKDEKDGSYRKFSIVEEVRLVVNCDERGIRLRTWVDERLGDSYPVECAEKMAEIANACVDPEPKNRPEMRWVAGQLSRVMRRSEKWGESLRQQETSDAGITLNFDAR